MSLLSVIPYFIAVIMLSLALGYAVDKGMFKGRFYKTITDEKVFVPTLGAVLMCYCNSLFFW